MNYITQVHLKNLAKQYVEGLICDVELLHHLQLGEPLRTQIVQLMHMPQAVRLNIKIEHLTKHSDQAPDFNALVAAAVGKPVDRMPEAKPERRVSVKRDLKQSREMRFFAELGAKLNVPADELAASVLIDTFVNEAEDDHIFTFRFLSTEHAQSLAIVLYGVKHAPAKHLRPKIVGRFFEVQADGELLREKGLNVPKTLCNLRREYLENLCITAYGSLDEFASFARVTIVEDTDQNLKFTFPSHLDAEALYGALHKHAPRGAAYELSMHQEAPKQHVVIVSPQVLKNAGRMPSALFFQ